MGCEHVIRQSLVHGEGLMIAIPRPFHKAHCEREGDGPTVDDTCGIDYSLDDVEGFSETRPRALHYLDS